MPVVIGDDMRELVEGGEMDGPPMPLQAVLAFVRRELLRAVRDALAGLSAGEMRAAQRVLRELVHALRLHAEDPPRMIVGRWAARGASGHAVAVVVGDEMVLSAVTEDHLADLGLRISSVKPSNTVAEATFWLHEHAPNLLAELEGRGIDADEAGRLLQVCVKEGRDGE